MRIVLVTGATGVIGKPLCAGLQESGWDVRILSRRNHNEGPFKSFQWDPKSNTVDKAAFENLDALIHLAGENLGNGRWTPERKKQIEESRVNSTALLYKTISGLTHKPAVFISASAIGYYGQQTSQTIFSEADKPASDFLGRLCAAWEDQAEQFTKLGIRTAKIRTGLVLATEGPLKKIAQPVQLGIGSPLGDGNQYMPWIHIDDICGIFMHVLNNANLSGAFNGVCPSHVTNRNFTRKLADVLNRPLWLPNVPAFILKTLLGEMSVLALRGSRVSSKKIENSGYKFKYTQLEDALRALFL